jgi:phage terminase large subunit
MVFPKCYFDKTKTVRLVESLKRYRRDVNQRTNEPGAPLHDEHSHSADMFRYLGQAVDLMSNNVSDKLESFKNRTRSWR